MGGLMSSEQSP